MAVAGQLHPVGQITDELESRLGTALPDIPPNLTHGSKAAVQVYSELA